MSSRRNGWFAGSSNEHGDVVRAKARLVARSLTQREGIEFFETFALTPAASSFLLCGAIACELGLILCHFDAEPAFVQSRLDEDISMRLPPGCDEMSGKVARLNRNLYGLKQASMSWHNHLLTHMNSLGFEQSPADACVMKLVESGSVSIVTVVHVDDTFDAGLKARCDQFCEDLNNLVPINNLGELSWYAGCCVSSDWDAGTLTTSQQAFAEKTAARFDVRSGRTNPLLASAKIEEFDENEPVGDWPFRELVGCLIWLANQTRPDIANAVKAVARYTNRPREVHWRTAVGILEYVLVRVI
ncbi:MAG: reverse transcriptase domain-containing protein [Hyphomicrobiales bacterium]